VPPRLPTRRPPSARLLRRLALASLVTNIGIVVSGGAVRLTASGLGCPSWPQCTPDSLVTTPALGLHGYVEFGNRLLTVLLALVATATLLAVLAARPRRRDTRRLAFALFLGIPAQAVLGGITVLTRLDPWVVMLHFLLSMVLVALAVVLRHRLDEGDGPPVPRVAAPLRWLSGGVLLTLGAVVYLGTVVTGSGPNAGDASARRTGLDPAAMSQLHADLVFLLLGLTVGLLVALHAVAAPPEVRRAAALLLAAELAQGVVGYAQYLTGLPVVLVNLHLLGAAVLVGLATQLVLTMRTRGPVPTASGTPGPAGTATPPLVSSAPEGAAAPVASPR